jgi:hypothetical protein
VHACGAEQQRGQQFDVACRYVNKFSELGIEVCGEEITAASYLAAAYLASEGIGLASNCQGLASGNASAERVGVGPCGAASNNNSDCSGDQLSTARTGSVLVFGMKGLLEELQRAVRTQAIP